MLFSQMFICNRDNFISISSLPTHHSYTVHPKWNEVTGSDLQHAAAKCKESDSTPHFSHMQTYKVNALVLWPTRSAEMEGQTAEFEQMGGRGGACKADVDRKRRKRKVRREISRKAKRGAAGESLSHEHRGACICNTLT